VRYTLAYGPADATATHCLSCFSKIQIGFTFLVPVYPGSPGQRAAKRVCACVLLTYLPIHRKSASQTLGWADGRTSTFESDADAIGAVEAGVVLRRSEHVSLGIRVVQLRVGNHADPVVVVVGPPTVLSAMLQQHNHRFTAVI